MRPQNLRRIIPKIVIIARRQHDQIRRNRRSIFKQQSFGSQTLHRCSLDFYLAVDDTVGAARVDVVATESHVEMCEEIAVAMDFESGLLETVEEFGVLFDEMVDVAVGELSLDLVWSRDVLSVG